VTPGTIHWAWKSIASNSESLEKMGFSTGEGDGAIREKKGGRNNFTGKKE